jgi:hypothetical protein
MKSVTSTYPGFHELPKGVKQLLLISESFFFSEARPTLPASDSLPGSERFNPSHSPTPHPAFGHPLPFGWGEGRGGHAVALAAMESAVEFPIGQSTNVDEFSLAQILRQQPIQTLYPRL